MNGLNRRTALLVLWLVIFASTAFACPFCGAPQTTLSERLSKSHVVVLVKWLEAANGNGTTKGHTRFLVLESSANESESIAFAKGDTIQLPRPFFAKPGTICLLFGTKSDEMRWDTPLEASPASHRYLQAAPKHGKPSQERLAFFLPHLESADSLIATDAFAEFALAPYDIVESLASQLPHDKLRSWLHHDQTVANRRGLFGLMLGLCGEPSDASFLKAKIEEPFQESPLGRDGMIFGYLLLTGSNGLDWIDDTKVRQRDPALNEDELALNKRLADVTAVVQALEVLWTTGRHGISRERLRLSMRRALAWPEVGGRVIANLSLWRDWSAQAELLKLYESEREDRSLQKAIIGYFFAAANAKLSADELASVSSAEKETLSANVLQAQANLQKLRTWNPKQVEDVGRFFDQKR